MNEMEFNLLLYFTETQRLSATIINEQVKNVQEKNSKSVEAMHNLKEQAHQMKEALLKGELNKIGEILSFGWQNKKNMAHSISNQQIDKIYNTAMGEGATGGKISGAGGGGFMFFFCPGITKMKVAKAIEKLGGRMQPFKFTQQGLVTWTIN
jgi:D-glycero-alpha-D-manno-heptose-7-phosphate kinase